MKEGAVREAGDSWAEKRLREPWCAGPGCDCEGHDNPMDIACCHRGNGGWLTLQMNPGSYGHYGCYLHPAHFQPLPPPPSSALPDPTTEGGA